MTTTMPVQRALVFWLILSSLLVTRSASAHELSTNTARIEVRGPHVKISAELDLFLWLEHAEGIPDEALRSATIIALIDQQRLDRSLEAARALFAKHVMLVVDGQRVTPERVRFPDTAALVRAARQQIMAGRIDRNAHPSLLSVTLEARLQTSAKHIALTMPPELGPVLVTLTRPRAALVNPGAAAEFDIEPNRKISREPYLNARRGALFLTGMCLGALMVVAFRRLAATKKAAIPSASG